MSIKVICIQNGIPLWSSAYPSKQSSTDSLLGSFLSAIMSFGKVTAGKTIKNMTIGDTLWSFVNIEETDDLFITTEIDVPGQEQAKQFRLGLIKWLLNELVTEFKKTVDPKDITPYIANDMSVFQNIQDYAAETMEISYQALQRYDKHDLSWLANFKGSDRLFTALMKDYPIFVKGNCGTKQDLEKTRATIEFIKQRPILLKDFTTTDAEILFDNGIQIFCAKERYLPNLPAIYPIIDMENENIINGPEASEFAQKKVLELSIDSEGPNPLLMHQSKASASDDNILSVQCKLCDELMQFQPGDDSSYFSKEKHQTYFGMDLTTFKITHIKGNNIHMNSVLLDDEGSVKDTIDAHSIPLNKSTIEKADLHLLGDHQTLFTEHDKLGSMFFINIHAKWIKALICPSSLKPLEIGKILLEKYDEVLQVYSDPPKYTSLFVADKKYHVWREGDILIALNNLAEDTLEFLNQFSPKMLEINKEITSLITKDDQLYLIFDLFQRGTVLNSDITLFYRIITDDRLYSPIYIKYPEYIPRIINRVKDTFDLPESTLKSLLEGKKSIMQLLYPVSLPEARDIVELVDFINRRHMIKKINR